MQQHDTCLLKYFEVFCLMLNVNICARGITLKSPPPKKNSFLTKLALMYDNNQLMNILNLKY
jgi:hypothetical protein